LTAPETNRRGSQPVFRSHTQAQVDRFAREVVEHREGERHEGQAKYGASPGQNLQPFRHSTPFNVRMLVGCRIRKRPIPPLPHPHTPPSGMPRRVPGLT